MLSWPVLVMAKTVSGSPLVMSNWVTPMLSVAATVPTMVPAGSVSSMVKLWFWLITGGSMSPGGAEK